MAPVTQEMNTQWDACLRHGMFQTVCCDSTICTYIKENTEKEHENTFERQRGFLPYFYTGIDLTAATAGRCYV